MLGFDILSFCSIVAEVDAQLRQPPLLLAILATLPPKSSSLYVHVNLGRELSEVMCKKKMKLGLYPPSLIICRVTMIMQSYVLDGKLDPMLFH